jgi:hypothetical protein
MKRKRRIRFLCSNCIAEKKTKKNLRPHTSDLIVDYRLQNWIFGVHGQQMGRESLSQRPPATGKVVAEICVFESRDPE